MKSQRNSGMLIINGGCTCRDDKEINENVAPMPYAGIILNEDIPKDEDKAEDEEQDEEQDEEGAQDIEDNEEIEPLIPSYL